MTKESAIKSIGFLTLLLVFFVSCVVLYSKSDSEMFEAPPASVKDGRVIVVIVDSLRPENLIDGTMPGLAEFANASITLPVTTCRANFSLPCMQTLYEGRESPFAAGLMNFTGAEGNQSIVEAAARGGWMVKLISDQTLTSLYGAHAGKQFDIQTLPPDHLLRDTEAIAVAKEWVTHSGPLFLSLHIVGTDKAAHHYRPDTLEYRAHYQAVDKLLMDFLNQLDLEKDHLIITGDHGHGPLGHHTRDSLAIFRGPTLERFLRAEVPIDLVQHEVTYFMALVLGVPLSQGYEGRFFEPPNFSEVQALAEMQRALLGVGSDTPLDSVFEVRRAAKLKAEENAAWTLLLPILFWSLVLFLFWLRPEDFDGRRWGVVLLTAATSIFVIIQESTPLVLLVFVPLFAGMLLYLARKGLVSVLLFVAVVLLAFLASGHAEWVRDTFHTRGGIHPMWGVWYVTWIFVGLLISKLSVGRVTFAPEVSGALLIALVPSGVYYYQLGQNMVSGLVFGSLGLAIWWVVRVRRRPKLPKIAWLLVPGMVFLLLQEAGGWEWKFFPQRWLAAFGFWPNALLTLPLILAFTKLAGFSLWAFAGISTFWVFSVVLADLPAERFVTGVILGLFAVVWLRTTHKARAHDRAHDGAAALLVWSSTLFCTWTLLDGFKLDNVDFAFALSWFSWVGDEALVFVLTEIATSVKYGSVICLPILAARGVLGAQKFPRVATMSWTLALVGILLFTGKILFGRAFQSEQMWELTVQDLIFTTNAGLIMVATAFVILIFDLKRERRKSRSAN